MSISTFPTAPSWTAWCASAVFASGNRSSGRPAFSPTGSLVYERECDVFYGRRQGRVADGVEQDKLVAKVLDHAWSDGKAELAAPVVGVDGDGPARLDHIDVELRVGRDRDLDNEVDTVRREFVMAVAASSLR